MGPFYIEINYFQTKNPVGKVKIRLYFLKLTIFNVKITIDYQIKAMSRFIYASETPKNQRHLSYITINYESKKEHQLQTSKSKSDVEK